MKVEIKISPEVSEPYAIIYAYAISDEILKTAAFLDAGDDVIMAKDGHRINLLRADEIYMVRVEAEKSYIYTENDKYVSGKRLYELESQFGVAFMRISKSTIVRLEKIASVESLFNSMMLLVLKNGLKDYISRKYLPDFKKYLGL